MPRCAGRAWCVPATAVLHPGRSKSPAHANPRPGVPQVNAASLREMAPGQRAELNATRAALGPGYEARLRKEAGAWRGGGVTGRGTPFSVCVAAAGRQATRKREGGWA